MNIDKQTPKVIVVGTSCIDIFAGGDFKWEGARSMPASIHLACGGSGRNIAENLAHLGQDVTLLTVIGNDFFGKYILQSTSQAGVHVVAPEEPIIKTPIYLALTSPRGQVLLDMWDGKDYLNLFSLQFGKMYARYLDTAHVIVTSTDTHDDLFFYLADISFKRKALLLLYISAPVTAFKAKQWISKADVLVMNEVEASIITEEDIHSVEKSLQTAQKLLSLGPELVVITLGMNGVCFASRKGFVEHRPAIDLNEQPVSTVGAGDAMCAGLLYGLINKFRIQDSMLLGLAAAALTTQCMEAVNPSISNILIQ